MKIAAVAKDPTDTNLRTLAQIGVEHQCFYGMAGMPTELEGLRAAQQQAVRNGLQLSVVEGGPPIDLIVLGKDGRDAQIETYKRALGNMGKLGINTLCYNFMPQITEDAMVIRTSFETPERGGAPTSSFKFEGSDNDRMTAEGTTTDEQMWDNLDYFLKRIIPAAEAAEVNLAMHPDEPPPSPMWNLSRIMRSVENYDRMLSMHPSPVNGLTFCQGCFAELGVDIDATIRHFDQRIHFGFSVIQAKGRAACRRDAQMLHQRLRTMMPRADGHSFFVQHRRDIMRVRALHRKRKNRSLRLGLSLNMKPVQPRKALGRTAVDMIMDLLSRPPATVPARNHVVLQPELVVRESA